MTMKSGILSLVFLCLVLLTPVKGFHSNFGVKCVPQKIRDSLNMVDNNNSPFLNNVEADYISYIFNLDTLNNGLKQKKVLFLTGAIGTNLVTKEKYFLLEKKRLSYDMPPTPAILYYFNPLESRRTNCDVVIVFETKNIPSRQNVYRTLSRKAKHLP